MEKRLLLAVLLMGAVIMVTNIFFPPVPRVDPAARADSARVVAPAAPRLGVAPPVLGPPPAAVPMDSVVVRSGLYEYVFSTRGAALTRAELLRYPSYTQPGRPVQLVPAGTRDFLAHRLVVGADTIDLRAAPFQPSVRSLTVDSAGGPQTLRFSYAHPSGFAAELTYTFQPDDYLVGVRGRVTGAGAGAKLLTHLGPGLAPHEAFDHHSERELMLVTHIDGDVDRERLAGIEGVDTIGGPLAWAGIKDKYFLAAIVAGDSLPMSGARVADLRDVRQPFVEDGDTSIVALPRAALTTELPLAADG